MGEDFWSYGVAPNRHVLEVFLRRHHPRACPRGSCPPRTCSTRPRTRRIASDPHALPLHPHARMEMRVHPPSGFMADPRRRLQIGKPRHLHPARGPK